MYKRQVKDAGKPKRRLLPHLFYYYAFVRSCHLPKHAEKVVGVFKLKEKFKKLKKAVDNTIYIRYTEYRSDEHKIIKHT